MFQNITVTLKVLHACGCPSNELMRHYILKLGIYSIDVMLQDKLRNRYLHTENKGNTKYTEKVYIKL